MQSYNVCSLFSSHCVGFALDFLKESSASVGYLLLVKTSGGVVYPSVLYCKVHGISRERKKSH